MRSRLIMTSVVSLALAGAPGWVPSASAQPVPMQSEARSGMVHYIVPVVVGVVIGALVVPMVMPAVVPATLQPAVAMAPAAAATATAWTWHSMITMPAVIGGVAGGLVGYAVAR